MPDRLFTVLFECSESVAAAVGAAAPASAASASAGEAATSAAGGRIGHRESLSSIFLLTLLSRR